MKFLSLISFSAAFAGTVLSTPDAFARDRYRGEWRDDGWRHGRDSSCERGRSSRWSVSVGVGYATPRPYYYGGPAVVYSRPVYVDERPVYVDERPVYVNERPVYYSAPRAEPIEVAVQKALARRGYFGGVIDGDVGPQTRAAIRVFQVDRGLPVTGRIDGNLLRELGLL